MLQQHVVDDAEELIVGLGRERLGAIFLAERLPAGSAIGGIGRRVVEIGGARPCLIECMGVAIGAGFRWREAHESRTVGRRADVGEDEPSRGGEEVDLVARTEAVWIAVVGLRVIRDLVG